MFSGPTGHENDAPLLANLLFIMLLRWLVGMLVAVPLCYFVGVANQTSPEQDATQPVDRLLPNGLSESDRLSQGGTLWLLSQQDTDGGWKSKTYGQMKGGAGTTALVAFALTQVRYAEKESEIREAVRKGITFLTQPASHPSDGPTFFLTSLESDYPTYAASYTLLAIQAFQLEEFDSARLQLKEYLIESQIREEHGVDPADPAYGAWEQTGGQDAPPPLGIQVDVAVTSLALRALAGEKDVPTDVFDRALVFLERCQCHGRDGAAPAGKELNGLGGFFFTSILNDPRNKAGVTISSNGTLSPRAYATSTIDVIAAASFCEGENAERLRSAGLNWLDENVAIESVPGFEEEESKRTWAQGLRYYYWAGLSEVLSEEMTGFGLRSNASQLCDSMLRSLIQLQSDNGSWRNDSNAMREDDPLIATSFALITISRMQRFTSRQPAP